MTALPLADFTAAEAGALARMEAEPDAPESLRERLARALHESDEVGNVPPVAWEDDVQSNHDGYLKLADAALDVLRGPSTCTTCGEAQAAVERVLDLADELDGGTAGSPGLGVVAHRIRSVVTAALDAR